MDGLRWCRGSLVLEVMTRISAPTEVLAAAVHRPGNYQPCIVHAGIFKQHRFTTQNTFGFLLHLDHRSPRRLR